MRKRKIFIEIVNKLLAFFITFQIISCSKLLDLNDGSLSSSNGNSTSLIYIVNTNNNSILSCYVSSEINKNQCINSGATGLNNPNGIAIYNGIAFITNFGTSQIISCKINGPNLQGCVDTGGTGYTGPAQIIIQNNLAYITSNYTHAV